MTVLYLNVILIKPKTETEIKQSCKLKPVFARLIFLTVLYKRMLKVFYIYDLKVYFCNCNALT